MLIKLYKICQQSESNFLSVLINLLYYKIRGKQIIAHELVEIKGVSKINTQSVLKIGVNYVGFISSKDRTLLNVRGRLVTQKGVQIGRGCRVDIGPEATVTIGIGSYINPFTKIIIMHNLTVGSHCAISWDCQFLDEDFHHINYEGKRQDNSNGIIIGNHVWIGAHVHIYKGTQIANGCIVAANSVVRGVFLKENSLVAGNPAKVIRSNCEWS